MQIGEVAWVIEKPLQEIVFSLRGKYNSMEFKKAKAVAKSLTESEYRALSQADDLLFALLCMLLVC